MKIIKLSDKQFEELDAETRRRLMEQLMIIDTPRYRYALGACGADWTLVRYDRQECIGKDKWEDGYEPLVVDSWK